MKKYRFLILLFIFLLLVIGGYFILRPANDILMEDVPEVPRNGVAIILTGAAARIPQEAALLEELDRRGMLKDLVFISGVSSGALNSVMLNAILDGKLSWEEYKKILFSLKTTDIFIQNGKKIPVNTEPARNLYKKIAEDRLGYHHIGDLSIPTSLSFTHPADLYTKNSVYRMCSRKINEESDTSLNLVDIMMASSAFPVVFPAVRINNLKTIPDEEFVDGGVGEDHVPYAALLEFEKYRGAGVEKVFIVSRKSDSIPEISEELKGLGINDKGF
ncbi:MAG: patatin-like phospholipase family protein [Bacteroidales bacterium]|nr:patatin-like phospholipase family protein [Bacteroidales bacterium]